MIESVASKDESSQDASCKKCGRESRVVCVLSKSLFSVAYVYVEHRRRCKGQMPSREADDECARVVERASISERLNAAALTD